MPISIGECPRDLPQVQRTKDLESRSPTERRVQSATPGRRQALLGTRAREVYEPSRVTPPRGQHELKTTDTDGAALDTAESRLVEQRDDLSWIDVTVTMNVREKTGLALRDSEVDGKHATLWLEHAADFACALLAHFARQVVKHERAQHHIKLPVREWQRLGNRCLEREVDPRFRRLGARSRNHLGGWVNANNRPARTYLAFGNNRQRSRAASDVEDRFAGDQMRQAREVLAERTIAAVCENPDQNVVAGRPMQNPTKRGWCRISW